MVFYGKIIIGRERCRLKKLIILSLLSIVFLSACSSQYDNDKVVAVVGGKEITLKDVRLIYDLDNKELQEVVTDYVKEEIMAQEAKKMEIDVTEEVEKIKDMNNPFPIKQSESQKKYAKQKAEKLGMSEEEYYKKYLDITAERGAYITKYIEMKLVEFNGEGEDATNKYADKVDEFAENLLKEHSEDYEILTK